MKVEIVYVHHPSYQGYAERFLGSYMDNPPSINHHTTIVCNAGPPDNETKSLFAFLPNVKFLPHDNSGYDLGAFQAASRESDSDMIVFFGASTYFKGQGWLLRMTSAFMRHGPAQYGVMGNQGDARCGVRPHIRTTAFWMAPSLFNGYPVKITRPEQRHPAEHGENCISEWVKSQGLHNWIVTWTETYPLAICDSIENGFHKGTQASLLCGDRISEPPYYKCR